MSIIYADGRKFSIHYVYIDSSVPTSIILRIIPGIGPTGISAALSNAVKNAAFFFVNRLQVRVGGGVAQNLIVVAQADFR